MPAASIAARRSAGTDEVKNSSTVGSALGWLAAPSAASAAVGATDRWRSARSIKTLAASPPMRPSAATHTSEPSARAGWNTQRSRAGRATVPERARARSMLSRDGRGSDSARSVASTAATVPTAPSASRAADCTSGSASVSSNVPSDQTASSAFSSPSAVDAATRTPGSASPRATTKAPMARLSPSAPSASAACVRKAARCS
jgi:hypothetical protein